MWFGFSKDNIEKVCFKYYWEIGAICLSFLGCLYLLQDRMLYVYCLLAIVFCAMIILLTMKIEIDDRGLVFWKACFWYILQRLSNILFEVLNNTYLFLIVSLLVILGIVVLFDYTFENEYQTVISRIKRTMR